MNRVGGHECLKDWDLYFALSELSEIPSPDISSQLSMKSALWINLNFSSLFNLLIPTLQYSVKSLANRYDCIDVPREKMYIYAPDIFLVSILNECSISITVLMCHREMYIYAPDNFLNEWMNELISERSMKNKKPMNILWKQEQWKKSGLLNEICMIYCHPSWNFIAVNICWQKKTK